MFITLLLGTRGQVVPPVSRSTSSCGEWTWGKPADNRQSQCSVICVIIKDILPLQCSWASLMVQLVKNPLAVCETWVPSLGWEDPLEEVMATHSRILAWRIPWTEEPGRLQFMGSQKVWHDWATKHNTEIYFWEFWGLNLLFLTRDPKMNSQEQWLIMEEKPQANVGCLFPMNTDLIGSLH